ncbi:MAG: hypothetical protein AMK72_01050 [Planctomycetes bacterium SM23_25]|nr:MAG: hypothetical protein AMS14_00640 [Planctomycetes bacterium DG_20]KPK50919.1 MAG: hypothetical protein AMK72_01050 [Planctomycetes bacterium SM23_25]
MTKCLEDGRLWRVEGEGWVEVHEPMTRQAWLAFLADKVGGKKQRHVARPPTYKATVGGRKVCVTVPERHDHVAYEGAAAEVLKDLLRDNLSPQAVAAIAAFLQPARTKDNAVNRQLRWFAEALTELVGGPEMQGRLAEEVGLQRTVP